MMIDTDKYENMRLLFLDFIDSASDEVDEEAWKDKLTMLDELLAEIRQLLAEIRQLNNIIGTFDDFMCNNWTPANVHSLWNELLTKEEE